MVPLTTSGLFLALALLQAKRSTNPVADSFGHASTIPGLFLAVALSVLVVVIAIWVELRRLPRLRRRRRGLPQSVPRLDPTGIVPPAVHWAPPAPEPATPPAVWMILAVTVALCAPSYLSRIDRFDDETCLWTWFGCLWVFALALHAEVSRPPRFRTTPADEDSDLPEVDPCAVEAPRRRLSRRPPDRDDTAPLVVGGACLATLAALVVLASCLDPMSQGFWDLPLLHIEGVAPWLGISVFFAVTGGLFTTVLLYRLRVAAPGHPLAQNPGSLPRRHRSATHRPGTGSDRPGST